MKEPITLATLAEATEQEVFDQVAVHLLRQGKRSSVVHEVERGLQCAAWGLISDEDYDIDMENNPWSILTLSGKVPPNHTSLISSLQRVHDVGQVDGWEDVLQTLASECNLDYNEEAYK